MESAFRDTCPDDLRVIETFARRSDGFTRLPRHLARLARTCARLGITPAPGAIDAALGDVPETGEWRVRLSVGLAGDVDLACAPLSPAPALWRLGIAGQRLDSSDPWLGVKTTRRALYDQARAGLPEGLDELIFLNERGELAEGTICNLFVETPEGLATPPLASGLLPGVLREEMLEQGAAVERVLTLSDLESASAIFAGNSLRGLIPARLADPS